MNHRLIAVLLFTAVTLSPAVAGLKRQDGPSDPHPSAPQSPNETEKALLDRLISELKRSSRSFVYLRSVGFNLTDEEFAQFIVRNNGILRPTRIVRYDKEGNRQTPGWPGVSLTPEYQDRPERKTSPRKQREGKVDSSAWSPSSFAAGLNNA